MLASPKELIIDIPGGGPYGFKLQGGKEYRTPLVVLSMSPGGKALNGGLKEGDVITAINCSPTHGLRHPDALKLVKAAKVGLNLAVVRGLISRDEGLEAMRQYSEEECLPPPPDDVFPPPPMDDMGDIPSSNDAPPPPPPITTITTPAAIKAAQAKSEAKEAEKVRLIIDNPAEVKRPPPVLAPVQQNNGEPPQNNGEPPKSILSQFGGEITEKAKQRENGNGTGPSRKDDLDSWISKMAGEAEGNDMKPIPPYHPNPPVINTKEMYPPRSSPLIPKVEAECPVFIRPEAPVFSVNKNVGVASPVAKAAPPAVDPSQPKVVMPASNVSLLNMAYTPGKSRSSSSLPTTRLSRGSSFDKVPPKADLPSTPPPACVMSPAKTSPPFVAATPPPVSKPFMAATSPPVSKPFVAATPPPATKPAPFVSPAKTPAPFVPVMSPTAPAPLKPARTKSQDLLQNIPPPPSEEEEVQLKASALKARFEQKPDDSQDLIKPKFGNKGNFYNRFPVSPTNSTTVAPNLAKLQSPSPTGAAPKPFSSPSPTVNKSFGYTPSPKPTPAFKNFKSIPVRPKPKEITPPPSPEPMNNSTFSPPTKPMPNFNSTFSSAPKSLDSPPVFNKSRNSSSSSGGNVPVRPNMVSLLDGLTVNDSPSSVSRSSTSLSPTPGKKDLMSPMKTPVLPICKTCNIEIRGPYVGAQGRAWHSEHFVCSLCKGDLTDGFKEVEDVLYCGTCYFTKHGDKCAKCGEIIMGSAVEALGNTYHPDHFTCTKCDARFSGGFNVNDGNPYCQTCYNAIFMPSCAGCGETIEGITEWISALEKNWHNGCFVCSTCRAPLGGKTFYQKNGQAVCQKHAKGK